MIALWLPIKTVSEANRREHWASRARRVKAQRAAVTLALRCQRVDVRELQAAPHIRVLLVRTGRRLDDDNLRGAMKAVRDAVAAWVGIDDGSDRWEWCYDQRPGKVGVELVIGMPDRN